MFKKNIILFSLMLLVNLPTTANATGLNELQTNFQNFGEEVGYNKEKTSLTEKIANIINIVLGFIGMLATIMIIFGGFKWLTAQGNEDQVTQAKTTIKNTAIGIIIIFLSYIIVNFTANQLTNSTSEKNSNAKSNIIITKGSCNFTIDGTQGCNDDYTETQCDKMQGTWTKNSTCPQTQ